MAASAAVTCNGIPPCQSRSGAGQGYDLNLNRYKELVHEEVEHRPPLEHLAEGMLR